MIEKFYKKYVRPNLANVVSFLGLFAAILMFVTILTHPEKILLIMIFGSFGFLTDFVDGRLARKLGIESNFGSAIDRLKDKILICPNLLALVWQGRIFLNNLPLAFTILTISLVLFLIVLEILLLIFWIIGVVKKLDVGANKFGKAKMFCECLVVIFWLASVAFEKYLETPILNSSIYLVDFTLAVAIFLAGGSLKNYWERYYPKKSSE